MGSRRADFNTFCLLKTGVVGAAMCLAAATAHAGPREEFVASVQQGSRYYESGDYAHAAEFFERGAKLGERVFGSNHPNFAAALFLVALAYQAQGRDSEAGDLPKLAEPALVLSPPTHPTPEDDGLLRASQVSQLKLNADFVILSACNTAASNGSPGAEGLSGLAKSFFYAGSRSLLVSHWPVDSDATVKLATGLIHAIADDPSIGRAEALRRSILAMIDGASDNSGAAHPALWAPFILAGEGGAGK